MKGREIEVTFKGRIIGKRKANNGEDEYQVTWSPAKMLVVTVIRNSKFDILL